jgi:hypothetical protein
MYHTPDNVISATVQPDAMRMRTLVSCNDNGGDGHLHKFVHLKLLQLLPLALDAAGCKLQGMHMKLMPETMSMPASHFK